MFWLYDNFALEIQHIQIPTFPLKQYDIRYGIWYVQLFQIHAQCIPTSRGHLSANNLRKRRQGEIWMSLTISKSDQCRIQYRAILYHNKLKVYSIGNNILHVCHISCHISRRWRYLWIYEISTLWYFEAFTTLKLSIVETNAQKSFHVLFGNIILHRSCEWKSDMLCNFGIYVSHQRKQQHVNGISRKSYWVTWIFNI